MMGFFIILLLSISQLAFSQTTGKEEAVPDLEIARKYTVVSPVKFSKMGGPVKISETLYSLSLTVPPTFMGPASPKNPPVDPFAPDSEPAPKKMPLKSAQKFLEDAGITFGPGAYARYIPGASVLTVVSTREQLDLVEVYCCIGCGHASPNLYISCDIFEISENHYEQIILSSQIDSNHEPERQTLLKASTEGQVKKISSFLTPARSGNKSEVTTILKQNVPVLISFSPVLGADNQTIEIEFQIKYKGQEIEGTTSIQSHNSQMVGDWKIEANQRRIVFLKAWRQYF